MADKLLEAIDETIVRSEVKDKGKAKVKAKAKAKAKVKTEGKAKVKAKGKAKGKKDIYKWSNKKVKNQINTRAIEFEMVKDNINRLQKKLSVIGEGINDEARHTDRMATEIAGNEDALDNLDSRITSFLFNLAESKGKGRKSKKRRKLKKKRKSKKRRKRKKKRKSKRRRIK